MPSEFSSIGITLDIGKIIILQYFPERYLTTTSKIDNHTSFYESEVKLGYENITHCEIGAYFLDLWNLPSILIEAALFHAKPNIGSDRYLEISDIIFFLGRLIDFLTINESEIEFFYHKPEYITNDQLLEISNEIRELLN